VTLPHPRKLYKCDVEGCTKVFTTSKRDIDRHKAGVHGPPVTLPCGDVLKYRRDNISRHRKKCPVCAAEDRNGTVCASAMANVPVLGRPRRQRL
jgi:hypothetical protein